MARGRTKKKPEEEATEEKPSKKPVKRGSKKVDVGDPEDVVEEAPSAKKTKKSVKNDSAAGGGKVVKISIEHCKSWQKFKRMAKEYLEHFATSFPDAEQVTNPEKSRYGAFNISITLESGNVIEVWDGKSKGPPRWEHKCNVFFDYSKIKSCRKEKFPDKDEILNKIKDEASS